MSREAPPAPPEGWTPWEPMETGGGTAFGRLNRERQEIEFKIIEGDAQKTRVLPLAELDAMTEKLGQPCSACPVGTLEDFYFGDMPEIYLCCGQCDAKYRVLAGKVELVPGPDSPD